MSESPENMTPPPPPSPPPSPPPIDGLPSAEERQWAMFGHLSALVAGLVSGGWGCFLGPLIIWLVKKDTMPFVADQAKEALNFSITVTAIMVILWIFGFVTLGIGFFIAIPVMILLAIGATILVVMAAIKANEGHAYRYPLTVRVVK